MSYTNAALMGYGDPGSYTEAALMGYGDPDSYTEAALMGYGDPGSYTEAALMGYGDSGSYTEAALKGYGKAKSVVNKFLRDVAKAEKKRKKKEKGGHALFTSRDRVKRKEFKNWVNSLPNLSQRERAALMPFREGTKSDAEIISSLKKRYNRIPKYVKKQLPEMYTEQEIGQRELVASLYRMLNEIYPEYGVQLRKRASKNV